MRIPLLKKALVSAGFVASIFGWIWLIKMRAPLETIIVLPEPAKISWATFLFAIYVLFAFITFAATVLERQSFIKTVFSVFVKVPFLFIGMVCLGLSGPIGSAIIVGASITYLFVSCLEKIKSWR